MHKQLAIDADGLLYGACLCKKEEDETGFVQDLEDASFRFDEKFMKIHSILEEGYDFDVGDIHDTDTSPIFFIKGRGNFRKFLYKPYKARRKSKPVPPMLEPLTEWVRAHYTTFTADNVEVDDVIASYWARYSEFHGRDEIIIVGNDKDYFQLPALIFDTYHARMELFDVSNEESQWNYALQLVEGDAADEYNFLKGWGKKKFTKFYEEQKGLTPFDAARKLYEQEGGLHWKKDFEMANLIATLRKDLETVPSIF